MAGRGRGRGRKPTDEVAGGDEAQQGTDSDSSLSSGSSSSSSSPRGVTTEGSSGSAPAMGRGRGRGRGRAVSPVVGAAGRRSRSSSSSSSLSLSPERVEAPPQGPGQGLVCGGEVAAVAARVAELEVVKEMPAKDLGPPPRVDEQFPMARARGPDFLPPQPRVSGLFPGKKTTGRACKLQTNHFPISLKFDEGGMVIYMYDVQVVPPWRREYKRTDKQLYHDTIAEWKKVCPAAMTNQHCWVFDGHKQLFCTKSFRIEELPDQKVAVWFAEEERTIDMMVKDVVLVNAIPVSKDLMHWAETGRSGEVPQDALQALDIVLKEAVNLDMKFYNIGRQYFPMDGQTLDVGFGKEVWCGTFSQVRPYGWKDHQILITLNVDTAHKPAARHLHLTKESAPGKGDSYIQQVLSGDGRRKVTVNFVKGLTDEQSRTMTKDMEGLKVKYTIPTKEGQPPHKRIFRVNGLKKAANKEMIADLGKTVEQYFKDQYEVDLQFPALQLVWVGSKHKTIFVPMEFCQMEKQPMPRKKKLPDDAIAKMIRFTAVKPQDRQKKILDNLMKNNKKYKDDPYAREFGINVSGEMATLTGRVLDAPSIEYAGGKAATINKANPGKWFQDKNMYVAAEKVSNWALLDLAQLTADQTKQLVGGFSGVGKDVGMAFNKNQADILMVKGNMRDAEESIYYMEDKIKKAMEHFKTAGKKMDLLMIVFPFKAGFLYGKIKQLCDMKYGVVTQCFLKDTVFKNKEVNKMSIGNICLKINAKLGGINHVLSAKSKPALLKRPVMVMGADVSHPAPESRGSKPSIAAVVASVDPRASRYEVEVRVQDGAQNEEVIHDMKNVTKNLLMKFHAENKGRKPEKVVMYRDGVSEGQFLTVLASELVAIRQACRELEDGYQPQVTYVVVQKRHNTRFFPSDNNKYKNGNALAGTVVDQGINHPTEGDFYLLSHEGIQGTSRPCHYHVLWDDNDFSADDLETLSYYLCHLYSRCTRAVSYPTPTYYAHLVADRARQHHNELAASDGGGSVGSGSSPHDLTDKQRRDIKSLVETTVHNPMYFV